MIALDDDEMSAVISGERSQITVNPHAE